MDEPGSESSELALFVDEPRPDSLTGPRILVRGWVVRRGGGVVEGVDVRLGSRAVRIPTGEHRPDVAEALDEPAAAWSGFQGWIVAEESELGHGDQVVVSAADAGGATSREIPIRVLPSSWSVIEVERCAPLEDRLEVEGWLIWRDVDPPAEVDVLLGEERVGRTLANLSRPDISRSFPGARPGACRGFHVTVDPSLVAAGRDSIELRVVATDQRGRRLEQTTRATSFSPEDDSRRSAPAGSARFEAAIRRLREEVGRELSVLDWESGLGLQSRPTSWLVFEPPPGGGASLPYLAGTIDVVALASVEPERVAEARRVAGIATFEGESLHRVEAPVRRREMPGASILVYVSPDSTCCDDVLSVLTKTVPPSIRGGIQLLDDATSREVTLTLQRWAGERDDTRVLRSEAPLGFARSANRAAALACGDIVVFLGADAVPQSDWLKRLLEPFRREPAVGAVFGRAEATGGRIDGPGPPVGEISEVGNSAGLSRGDRPRHGALREVEACSAALVAVRRAKFLEVGGFPGECAPGGDPGAELCARLRARSGRILHQPSAVVKLRPGAVDPVVRGPSELRRDARGPVIARFFRWRDAMRERPVGRRVLVAAPRMPEFDREAGSRRLFHFVELLRETEWEVSFLALESSEGGRYVKILQDLGVAVFAGPDSMRAGDEYLDRLEEIVEGRFDVAIIAFWRVAERLLPLFRENSPQTSLIVDSVDLHCLREERAALRSGIAPESSANLMRRLERRQRELDVYSAADSVLTVSAREARLIREATGGRASAFCVPIPETMEPSRVGFGDRQHLLFLGNFRHRPNLEGLEYLCREVLPRVGDDVLEWSPLVVVGNEVDDGVRALVEGVPHARVVGWVPSVLPYLETARVSLISLLSGAGTKGKLIQALMVGTPSVSTSIGIEGLDLVDGRHVLVADTAEEFAEAIRRLATDPVLWTRIARNGRDHVLRRHGRETVRNSLLEAIDRTLRQRRCRRSRLRAG